MRIFLKTVIFSMVIWSTHAIAAPAYVGPGCDSEGKGCLFGRPSQRVQEWSSTGSTAELGSQCEVFLQRIQEKKKQIIETAAPDFVLEFRNFTYSWTNKVDSNGRADIRCSIELHSENPKYLLVSKNEQSFFWVCNNSDDPGICRHTYAECEQTAKENLSKENVLATRMTYGASLVQGQICYANSLKIKIADEEAH
jgi:hypothetical protein